MDARYVHPQIASIWGNEAKLARWQETELAVIGARADLGRISPADAVEVASILTATPIDISWWLEREKETKHDLAAFVDERVRHLPVGLQRLFHSGMTSYDTEESAFVGALDLSAELVYGEVDAFLGLLLRMAHEERFTVMMGRTHGQEAQIMSFGKRILSWYRQVRETQLSLHVAMENLRYSKLSGAIGNNAEIDAELEQRALARLGRVPYHGATQILPRELFHPLAASLAAMAQSLNKVALDIRLGARSGRPLYREPFGKGQKGSSAMPHKKNPIAAEQMQGMANMAAGYANMILSTIATWEERAIEQSCVERVAWPDLFHAVLNMLAKMTSVMNGLRIYRDQMLLEVVESNGCYATSVAKEFLKERGAAVQIDAENAYRIVQLAAFNAFETSEDLRPLSERASSFEAARKGLAHATWVTREGSSWRYSIQELIPGGQLRVSDELAVTAPCVQAWNSLLRQLFANAEVREEWDKLFTPEYHLAGEVSLFEAFPPPSR